ncbi:hypothetical protein BGX38DRAFT_1233585, partial [Terfezia claveryi]
EDLWTSPRRILQKMRGRRTSPLKSDENLKKQKVSGRYLPIPFAFPDSRECPDKCF